MQVLFMGALHRHFVKFYGLLVYAFVYTQIQFPMCFMRMQLVMLNNEKELRNKHCEKYKWVLRTKKYSAPVCHLNAAHTNINEPHSSELHLYEQVVGKLLILQGY